jgi:creatinine amidohydrolase
VLWHEQTSPAIGAASKDMPVVVPLGACEQHGRHLPVLVDTIQVSAVAERVEQRLRDKVIITPTLWLGSSHHHLDFPGTISVRPSLYSEVVQEIARSIMSAGFTRIFFLNGHGGNELPASAGLAELIATDDRADNCYLTFASWWRVGGDALEPQRHGMTTPAISHACEYETSMLLFLRPDLVKMEQAKPNVASLDGGGWYHSEYGGKVKMFRRFHRLTATGSMGDPSAGTAQKGRSMLDAVVEDTVRFLEDFSKWPPLPPLAGK